MLIAADARLGRHSYYKASAPCAPPPLQGRVDADVLANGADLQAAIWPDGGEESMTRSIAIEPAITRPLRRAMTDCFCY
ncbi:hypothetical protein [Polaromonas glacialis]|uniref:hypothetical protein n=1 Tax=Polaromonas glacialis TaxID=866564 RepID=UPI0004970040|nr:hypothetical protein [Polaromonas glacialis]